MIKHVVFVDDCDHMRKALSVCSEHHSIGDRYKIDVLESPRALYNCLMDGIRIDIAVLDVVMYPAHGPEVAERIRNICDEIKIVFLTNLERGDLFEKAQIAGDAVVQKGDIVYMLNDLDKTLASL